jgi:type IV secretion system protein VirB6
MPNFTAPFASALAEPAAAIERLIGLGQAGGGLMDAALYGRVYIFVRDEIREIGPAIMERFMSVAAAVALTLMTIWILYNGYRILTGQARESMSAFVLTAARNALVVSVASSMALMGSDLQDLISDDLTKVAMELVTGEYQSPSSMIEQNIVLTQVAMSSIDAVQVSEEGSINLTEQKNRSMMLAGFGAAGPAVTAGAMLLMYEIALALFLGFGPLFVLCLMSDTTKQLFWKWLYYGIGTVFSMAVLALMTGLALKVVAAVAIAFWGSTLVGTIANANFVEGMNSAAMQQGGIGLLLTLLLISTPPIAANFFQGALGNFSAYSMFNAGGSSAGRAGANPGETGYRPTSYAPPVNTASSPWPSAQPAPTASGFNNPASVPYSAQTAAPPPQAIGPGARRAEPGAGGP